MGEGGGPPYFVNQRANEGESSLREEVFDGACKDAAP
jgi:hypothetical protein